MAAAGVDPQVEKLIGELTLDEKLAMLDGDWPFWSGSREMMSGGYHRHPWNAGVIPRLGIHGVRFSDGPRGVVLEGGATTFPVTMARGATWDIELEAQIGDAIGQELRALGANLYGGVCINLLRHPAWGRAQETYGEDPVLLGAMGAALCRGVQRHAMACVKHFALNSMENARFSVDVRIAPRALHELYLPHFKQVVDAGVACVMSAYNGVNGEWCGQNHALLTDILKRRWGFTGFVVTDFVMGIRDGSAAILAGQDLEMPFQMHFHTGLAHLVASGQVPIARIEDAARRILTQQRRLGAPRDMPRSVLACAAHRGLAREAARKAIVLLQNERGVLPLTGGERIALIGRLAATANLGDRGSSDTRPVHVVTPLEGLRAAVGAGGEIQYDAGASLDAARALAARCDAAIVVVGYTYRDEGEFLTPPDFGPFAHGIPVPGPLRWLFAPRFMRPLWPRVFAALAELGGRRRSGGAGFEVGVGGDRSSLALSAADEALIRAVASANERTIVCVMAGSAVIMESWRGAVPSILMLWYPGMEGGHALADVLFGKVSPSGKMPFATPTDARHLPHFDRDAAQITYDLWHGYRKLDRDGATPAFPFGFGLSYAEFTYLSVTVDRDEVEPHDRIAVTVAVQNTGRRDAEEVVQLYAEPIGSAIERAPRELRGFARVAVPAGATRTAHIPLPVRSLAYFDEARDDFAVEPLAYDLIAARHERDETAPRVRIRVRG
ncbi:MAG TPA: glycoside hydrolase family 3 C-terminal domain-containing protein [Myxococcota bacterium]|nr:glycoside hydrolase family 3 C-terminal domain-containing protein [Myxococcota bacterium]